MKCARDMFFCDATWSFVEVSWVLLIGSPILDNSCTKEKKRLDFGGHVAFLYCTFQIKMTYMSSLLFGKFQFCFVNDNSSRFTNFPCFQAYLIFTALPSSFPSE